MEQIILTSENNYEQLDDYLIRNKFSKIFVVCGNSLKKHKLYNYFNLLEERLNVKIVYFSEFSPNPLYDSVCEGIKKYKNNKCDLIIAVGGGSAIDVAKCIKLFVNMDSNKNYLEQQIIENNIPLLAIPTTAGTGSEATKFAVIYYDGEKQSVKHDSCIPSVVLFDASFLDTLPIYQKKATVLDAFSHAIESMWSVNSTSESIKYAEQSLDIIINNMYDYFNGNKLTNEKMLYASNLAGKAINISQTTAGHAMCYKLTSLYNISHGHAAALVNSELFPYMIEHMEKCVDIRGEKHLINIFNKITELFGCNNFEDGANFIRNRLKELDLYNININYEDMDILVKSVNSIRLKNNPIRLETEDIRNIYLKIFDIIEKRN